jgi:hypothetical protein
MPIRSLLRRAAPALMTCLASCSDTAHRSGTPTGPGGGGEPARIGAYSGDEQRGRVGLTLPAALVALATDAGGHPVVGATVRFRVISGGGSVDHDSVATDRDGLAATHWTLGYDFDPHRVEVRLMRGGQQVAADTFSAGAFVPFIGSVTTLGDTLTSAFLGEQIRDSAAVLVRDQDGKPVPRWPVRWGCTGCTASAAETMTSDDGVAKVAWTIGYLGPPVLDSASIGANAGPPAMVGGIKVALRFPPGTVLARVSGDGQTGNAGAPLDQPLVVNLHTASGHPIEGALVRWTTQQGGSIQRIGVETTQGDGYSLARWKLGAGADEQTMTATVGEASTVFTARLFPIALAVRSPAAGATVNADALDVRATAGLHAALESAIATVEGRSVALAGSGGELSGTLGMSGVAGGPKVLRVRVRDVAGDSSVASVPFTYTRVPTSLAVTLPVPNMTANPNVPLRVECPDCAALKATLADNTVVATGTTALAAAPSLARFAGSPFRVTPTFVVVVATSAAGESRADTVPVYAADNPALERVVSGGFRMADTDGRRALYITPQNAARSHHLILRDLETGAETELAVFPPDASLGEGFLTPAGAIAWWQVNGSARLYEFRDGAAVNLGQCDNARGALKVAGPWAAWSTFHNLTVLDLRTGATRLVAANLLTDRGNGPQFDVAANGNLVYTTFENVPMRDAAGTPAPLGAGAGWDLRTDGTSVVFARFDSACGTQLPCETVWVGPTGSQVLQHGAYVRHAITDGWVAFEKADAPNLRQVWTRSPAGNLEQRSGLPYGGQIESLGPAGRVVFLSAEHRLLSLPGAGAATELLIPAAGWQFGTSFWRGTTGYVVIENTALRILP